MMSKRNDMDMMVSLLGKVISQIDLTESELDWIRGGEVTQRQNDDGKWQLVVMPASDKRIMFRDLIIGISQSVGPHGAIIRPANVNLDQCPACGRTGHYVGAIGDNATRVCNNTDCRIFLFLSGDIPKAEQH